MSISTGSVPHVIDASVLDGLAGRLTTVAQTVSTAMSETADRWSRLREVFDVFGAEGAYSMLDRPSSDAADFATALIAASASLSSYAQYTMPNLKTRRQELLDRIPDVNSAYESAQDDVTTTESAYWSAFGRDQRSDATTDAREARMDALHARDAAARDVSDLEGDIERFRRDVENAEEDLARELTIITGGTEVHGAWGAELHISQTYWGSASSSYPMGPITTTDLSGRLSLALSDAVADRIDWLGSAPAQDVQAWVDSHPDFAGAVGFVEPSRAVTLWNDLVEHSTAGGGDTPWATGPLAQLFGLAPFAIGNLNGLKATDRTRFNSEYLDQLLARDDLSEQQQAQLTMLRRHIDAAADSGEPERTLLSLFLETDDGSPRASIGYGDVDTADQINTMTHGIDTDLSSLPAWERSALAMNEDLARELASRGSDATTATVMFMEWDSGDMFNVWNIERPDGGAQRLSQLLRGFEASNPDAQRNLQLHSLGTTAGTQAIADNPQLVDGVWLYGSAGVTEQTAQELQRQILAGILDVHATHANDDWIAPLGRLDISEHPNDPRDIANADVIDADGGFVAGFNGGEQGERTEGHNSQSSTEWLYTFEGLEYLPPPPGAETGGFIPVWDDDAVGYLDPRSQAYKQSIVDLTLALLQREESR